MTDIQQALAKQMYHDPKLAYGVVTGAVVWPHSGGEDLGSLANMAYDKAVDLEQAATLGIPVSSHEIDRLYAAEQCFVWLEHDAEDAAREAADREWYGLEQDASTQRDADEIAANVRFWRSPQHYL